MTSMWSNIWPRPWQKVEIAADHPLAGAAWAKMGLVRAKVTLPNGYCGAPVQTDCEDAGLARVAERNRRTLGKLDKIISALEGTAENQIVVGGQVEDIDAAS